MWHGGVDGVAEVIELVRRDGMAVLGQRTYWPHRTVAEPRPVSAGARASARLPDGRELPATWRAWLAFDGAWLQGLGWFTSLEPLVFSPRSLVEIACDEHGDMWGKFFDVKALRHCFLLAGGSDSRRVLVLTDSPDSEGEHPVFYTDVDDQPALGALHPGLDAYLGWAVGLFEEPQTEYRTYTDTAKAPPFRERNAHHVKHLLGGEWDVEFPDLRLNQPAPAKKVAKKKAPKKKATATPNKKVSKKKAPGKQAPKKKAPKKKAPKAPKKPPKKRTPTKKHRAR